MWEMGGYGVYVWASYGIVMVGLVWLLLGAWVKNKRLKSRV